MKVNDIRSIKSKVITLHYYEALDELLICGWPSLQDIDDELMKNCIAQLEV